MSAGRKYLDVGEGFPRMPMERFVNMDKACAPERRHLVMVQLPEKVSRPDPSDTKKKIYAWVYTVIFHFFGRTPAAAEGAANRFMLAELRKAAGKARAVEARAEGRKEQAARSAKARGAKAERKRKARGDGD